MDLSGFGKAFYTARRNSGGLGLGCLRDLQSSAHLPSLSLSLSLETTHLVAKELCSVKLRRISGLKMSDRSEEMDIGILQQNVCYHLEKAFLEQAKAFSKSEGQKNDFKKNLEEMEAQTKELQKKLDNTETQNKDIQIKLAQSEVEKKELQEDYEIMLRLAEDQKKQKEELRKKNHSIGKGAGKKTSTGAGDRADERWFKDDGTHGCE
ncbi:hypothetical protein ACLB2K_029977 [Fragaria x ananassa]